MSSQIEPVRRGREIRNVALLDLTGAQAETALEGVTRISHVAAILVPEGLMSKLSSIELDRVAATVPVPEGHRIKVFSGQITLSGEALGGTGVRAEEMLVIAGQLILTSPVREVGYSDLVILGQMLAPRGSEAALGAAIRQLSGQALYYPYVRGADVRVVSSGAVSGEYLANAGGQPDDTLLVTGQLVVTSPIEQLGYRQVVAIGHIVVPKHTNVDVLGRLSSVVGQVASYTAPPRLFDGKDHFSAAYFELFEEPITLVMDGNFSFDEDVAPELLRQKLAGLVLDGKIRAPRRLVPMLQHLTIARDGRILADDEAE